MKCAVPCSCRLRLSLPEYVTVSGLAITHEALSFKRDLKVAGLDSYCAARRLITPLQFLGAFLCVISSRNQGRHWPTAYSGPGMCLLVTLAEPVDGDVGVDLRRGEAAVPQDLLNGPQIRTAVQEMSSR